jgi:hypothetical protein
LIVRGRAGGHLGLLGVAFERAIFEPIHFAMERKMMEGVKARAEGHAVSKAADNVQVSLWVATFIVFIASAILVLGNHSWRWRASVFGAAGLLFGVLTLVQPSVLIGAPLVLALCAALWGGRGLRHPSSSHDPFGQHRELTNDDLVNRW